jgi:hypothetical protein
MKGGVILEKRIAICTAVMIVLAVAVLFLFSRYEAGTASKPIVNSVEAVEPVMDNALEVEIKEVGGFSASARPTIDESDLISVDALNAMGKKDNPKILLTAAETPIEEIGGDDLGFLVDDSLVEPNEVEDTAQTDLPQDAASKNPQTSDPFTFKQIAIVVVSTIYLALIIIYFYLKKKASD